MSMNFYCYTVMQLYVKNIGIEPMSLSLLLRYALPLKLILRNLTIIPATGNIFLSSYPKHSRKEVFQPHLPVRLPCYDLAPVTSFTLGRSSKGHGLQAPPASMA